MGENPKSHSSESARSAVLERQGKPVPAFFFRTEAGREPVRDWLKGLPLTDDRTRIGEHIKSVEFGWPIGMPVCKPLGDGLFEVRISLMQNRIARAFLCRQEWQDGSAAWIHQKDSQDAR